MGIAGTPWEIFPILNVNSKIKVIIIDLHCFKFLNWRGKTMQQRKAVKLLFLKTNDVTMNTKYKTRVFLETNVSPAETGQQRKCDR